jgi:diguanylate cyclase (GGDEF)-like protein
MERANFDVTKAPKLAAKGLRFAGSLAMRATESPRRKIASIISPEQAEDARLAYVDYDTNAANKRALMKHLEYLAELGTPFAALVIDIDKFKDVNEAVGHFHADNIFVQFVDGLNSHIRNKDKVFSGASVFRTGGDELVVLASMEARKNMDLSYDQRLDSMITRLKDEYLDGYDFVSPGGVAVRISATVSANMMYPESVSDLPGQFNDLFVDVLAQKRQV